ncbi:MAG: Tat pathway signal sequence [Nocardioides sp.]
MRRICWTLGLLLVAGQLTSRPLASAVADPRPLPLPLHGLTLESVTPLRATVRAVRSHRVRPAVRIVFQHGEPPGRYAAAVRRLRRHAVVMGELLDSTAVRRTSVAAYRSRARAYVRRFGARVDLWEIGNELNGQWLGRPRTINAKVRAAYRVVEQEHAGLGLRSAITLNFWPSHDCYAKRWEATLRFARRMPREVRRGVDFVFLSFYETACDPVARPSVGQVARMFRLLTRVFPHAQVGFGETGAQRRSDGLPGDPTPAEKKWVARRYYGMHGELRRRLGPRYVGGYFWWYYADDAVPRRRPGSLWPTLDRLFGTF